MALTVTAPPLAEEPVAEVEPHRPGENTLLATLDKLNQTVKVASNWRTGRQCEKCKNAVFACFYGFSTIGRPNAAVQIGVIANCVALTDFAVASVNKNVKLGKRDA